MQQVKGFGVFQTAKFMAILYFLIAAVVCVLMIPFMLMFGGMMRESGMGGMGGGMMGGSIFFLILAPFIYAIVAFIATAIGCAIYNVVAKRFGGVEIDLRPASPSA
jgi:hypothetical protein